MSAPELLETDPALCQEASLGTGSQVGGVVTGLFKLFKAVRDKV